MMTEKDVYKHSPLHDCIRTAQKKWPTSNVYYKTTPPPVPFIQLYSASYTHTYKLSDVGARCRLQTFYIPNCSSRKKVCISTLDFRARFKG
ncbi:hypothetical protein K469DRAFT_700257 [Zopfia rhizophila CBS 207.26]|uniref:Uncharacterized protein n=1 Tax=Zopfia rhizophila CBS 207.26 TaxID=1314779 RepID=A0A6A6DEZ9_9PEZI|nr:hypothetical protein K469DRAFT_700257 [Zopfia rhizophila CBS 207.26]